MEKLLEELTWEIITQASSTAVLAAAFWYILTKYVPQSVKEARAEFAESLKTQRQDFVDALQRQRDDWRDEMVAQRQHDREIRELMLTRLEQLIAGFKAMQGK